MKINFFERLISLGLIPSWENKFKPYLLRSGFLYLCGFLTIATFLLLSPIGKSGLNKWLADLTEILIINSVNPDRVEAGLMPLDKNDKLTLAAQMKAEDMISRNYFAHIGPNNELPWIWLDRAGYKYAAAGENLAMDFSDPAVLEQAWLASPTHAANITNGYFTDIGIGIAKGKINNSETTVVVMFLGREVSSILAEMTSEEKIIENKNIANNLKKTKATVAGMSQTAPEEPVAVKLVDDEKLASSDLSGKPSAAAVPVLNQSNKYLKFFLINQASEITRYILTGLFVFMLLWLLALAFLRKLKFSFFAPRFAIFILFIGLLWVVR